MQIRKKWIMALCCVFMACVICASSIGCSFSSTTDNSVNLNAPKAKLENVTGQYDVGDLATANFNDSVLKLDTTQTEISVIIDLGGSGLYDIYDNTESFSDFVASQRAQKYNKALIKQQNTFISALQKSGIDYKYRGSYTALFNGVALRISSADYYKLGRIDGVKHVYRNEVYAIPEAVVTNFTPVYSTGVYDSSSVDNKGDGMLVAVLDTGLDYTHKAFQIMPEQGTTTWDYNRVKDVFTNGLTTDSGDVVQLHSKSLGYGIDDVFVNDKVPYAFDYADDDPDVYPSYSNHGTHVAGIIAGRDDDPETGKVVDEQGNRFIGVAPNAQLAIMKVFTDNLESKMLGGADSIDILHAINDCAILGVDVINMSLGSAGGFSDSASDEFTTEVYDRVQQIGISLIVAAGNEYSSGYGGGNGTNLATNPDSGTVGSPSTYEASLSVASIEGQKAPYVLGNKDTNETVAFITNSSDAYGNEIDFIDKLYAAVNKWNSENGKEPILLNEPLTLPYVVIGGVGNLINYSSAIRRQLRREPTIALIKRGDISFADKVQYAMDNGAIACVIYNNLSGTIRMSLGELVNPIPACSIGLEAGTNLVNNAVNGNGNITISKDYSAGPFMSEFSSWGPTPSLRLKPEITAYGGKILSAIPGGYDQLSGTSMASPNMAGMVALMRQHVSSATASAGSELFGADLNARVYQMLMSTATLVFNDEGNPYSPRKQGSGLGNLHAAINTNAYITVNEKDAQGNDVESPKTKIELYDDPQRNGEYVLNFTIHNISNGAVSYKPHVYNMTETLAIDGRTVAEKAQMLDDTDIAISVGGEQLTTERVTVPANSTVEITVKLTLGEAGRKYIEDSFKNGMYVEGFVRFEEGQDAQNKEINDIGIPYLAFYGDWSDGPMFDYDMYEISENENDSSIDWEDKIHASASATTPLGMYEDYYIIPLGSYVYTMEDSDVPINATDDHAAISIFNQDYGPIQAINEFYGVYAGMLRGAKEMEVSIVDTITGETVYRDVLHNQRKSYAGGGSNVGSPIVLYIRPFDWEWNNNTQYEFKLSGKLDWFERDENGEYKLDEDGKKILVTPEDNTFSFKFTVDYEAPSITDYRVRFEPYTENKETKYRIYMDVDVFDNQYSMALLPCYLEDKEIKSLMHYPLPIYSQKNEVTTVSFEITDYYEDYFLTGNMFLYPMDYAMNHALYRVTADQGIDYPTEITFSTDDGKLTKSVVNTAGSGENAYAYQVYRLSLAPNEVYKLVQTDIKPEGTVNHKLTWKSSNENVKANENEIFAGSQLVSGAKLTLYSGERILAEIMVNVRGEALNPPRLQSINFRPVVNGDGYVAAVGMSLPLNDNTQTQLVVECTPWYYGDVNLKWESNDESIATVDQNGLVTTHATGSAWISATCVDRPSVNTRVQVVVGSDYDVTNYRLYHYYGGEVAKIPDQLNIMYLDDECFQGNTTIRKVVLPKTLTEIPEGAFLDCTNLEEITIPASCVAVLNNAFQGCTSLKKVILSEFQNKVDDDITEGSLTLGIGAFYGCTSLTEITNPYRMTTLGNGAFYGCTSLTKIDISGLRIAGEQIFNGCTNLEKVTMSKQTKLGRSMFLGCSKLDNVTLMSEIIPDGLFGLCESLTTVTFDPSVQVKSIGDLVFLGCTSLEQITLPNGTYSIGADTFNSCEKLATVNIPKDAVITGDLLTPFSDCKALSAINVDKDNANYSSQNGILFSKDGETLLLVPVLARVNPSDIYGTVKHIGASAFAGNAYLDDIDLTEFQTIGSYAFAQTSLTAVNIPADWTKIPEGLFYGCKNLKTVEFNGESVNKIGAYAFYSCSNLATIKLPESVTEIGDRAFQFCSKLGSLDLANIQVFGSYSLSGTVITRINAPNATTLYDYAFMSMRHLITVKLGPVTYMGEGVFCDVQTNSEGETGVIGNSSIQSVEFAEGTTVIGAFAFPYHLVSGGHLTEVILPSTVKTIGEKAFIGRSELVSINLEGVETIGEQAFAGCTKLSDVDLSNVKTFGVASFYNTVALKTANLENAERILGSAFEGSGIETLTIPSAAVIDGFAFAETKITTVEIPASLKSYTYEDDAFYRENDAGDIEQVTGKMALSLKGGAFMDITTLTNFTVQAGNKTFFADEHGVLYANVNEGYVLVQYPAGKTDTEYEVLEGTVRIGDYAFYKDTHLAKITFPVSLKAIGAYAFYNNNTDGTFTREYVFKAVEAPVLESITAITADEYFEANENNLVFSNYLSLFSTVYYANFGNFAALIMEEDHVLSQFKWLLDQGEDMDGLYYNAPIYNYVITRPTNGIGYDNPVWTTYFSAQNTNLSAYAADRTTAAAIEAISSIISADEIKAIIDGITDNDAKLAKLNEISQNSLTQARKAYNAIIGNQQKALVTDYSKLLASEQMVRDVKAQLGYSVELTELKVDGSYKLRYVEGEKFDPQDMQIVAIYADGSQLELTPQTYTLNKTGALTTSDTSVTISYGDKSVRLPINVTAQPVTQHTVTFAGEGVTTSTQTVNDGGKATEPAEPQREGYTFKYWYLTDQNVAYDFDTAVTGNITLTAAWQKQSDEPAPQPTNVGLIVGLSVGGAVVLAGVAVLVVMLLRKKKLVANTQTSQTDDANKAE